MVTTSMETTCGSTSSMVTAMGSTAWPKMATVLLCVHALSTNYFSNGDYVYQTLTTMTSLINYSSGKFTTNSPHVLSTLYKLTGR